MLRNALRRLPSALKFTGGSERNLLHRQASTTQCAPIPSLMEHYNPVTIQPTLINTDFFHSNLKRKNILDMPIINVNVIDIPNIIIPQEDINKPTIVEEPEKTVEKQAARLIVIRRHKMRKHKLKKLRKKMKFVYAKARQKRELKKEKIFQAEMMGKIRLAESFDARQYVQEKLTKVNAVLIPKLWKGKRLPEFVIKDLLAKRERKKAILKQNLERRSKMNLNVSDYKF